MVDRPEDYRWSSHGSNGLGIDDPLVHAHAAYTGLGINAEQRCAAYRSMVAEAMIDSELDEIRLHLQRQHAFGPHRFRDAIEAQLGRRAGPAKIGRPIKKRPPLPARESVL